MPRLETSLSYCLTYRQWRKVMHSLLFSRHFCESERNRRSENKIWFSFDLTFKVDKSCNSFTKHNFWGYLKFKAKPNIFRMLILNTIRKWRIFAWILIKSQILRNNLKSACSLNDFRKMPDSTCHGLSLQESDRIKRKKKGLLMLYLALICSVLIFQS